jgi:hypothetical protein
MIEVRLKDKIFLALAVPAAVAGLYLWQWRPETAAKLESLRSRSRVTVGEAEFPGEKARRLAKLAEAEAGLKREESAPSPDRKVAGLAADTPAARTRTVVETFRAAGLRVVRSEMAAAASSRPAGNPADVLRATGIRPEPVRRIYRLEGGYGPLRRALAAFEENRTAVIVGALANEGFNRWRVTVDE